MVLEELFGFDDQITELGTICLYGLNGLRKRRVESGGGGVRERERGVCERERGRKEQRNYG